MSLSSDLIAEFVKVTKDETPTKSESTVYGTVVEYNNSTYVKIDGSDQLTPVTTTAVFEPGERVAVLIKNHTATVTGNITSPSARDKTVEEVKSEVSDLGDKITEVEILVADKVSTEQLAAEIASIDQLYARKATITELQAKDAEIEQLVSEKVSAEELKAEVAEIEELISTKVDADIADITYATIKNLDATNANIRTLESTFGDFQALTTNKFEAVEADIKDLDTQKLSAEEAELKYANIDFANIDSAAIETFFSKSGMISDLVVGDGTIAGKLVGVTITGDLIEGNTVKADKLVVLGEDGLYYKLNFDAGTFASGEAVPTDSLHGSVITAKSITAEKITVNDLVAFGATIGGFHITDNSIYSGVKKTIDNTTRGIYFDNDGQIAFGDSDNFIKFYKDTDGTYKLEIAASSMKMSSSSKTVEEEIATLKDEITTNLRIESSRGTVFKNDSVSTVLSAVIYRGSQRITDIDALHSAMGSGAYLQWKWQRLDEETFGTISSSDSRLGNGGFTLTLSPEDVDTKVTFMCELIV